MGMQQESGTGNGNEMRELNREWDETRDGNKAGKL